MPELPEVEAVRTTLERARIVAPIEKIYRSRLPLRTGEHWRQENLTLLRAAAPRRLVRRGKYIVWDFERDGATTLGLLLHLGMSGRLLIVDAEARRAKHTHIAMRFADGREVRFVDPRRFGGVRVLPREALLEAPPLCDLGPEPLDPGLAEHLQRRAGGSRRVIRDVLLDQHVVAGIGNIYATEALFEASIHPLSRATLLRPSAWQRLANAIVLVLRRGIRNGGTTLRDFVDARGRRGKNQECLRAYGNAGQPCPRCGAPLQTFTQAGRSGVFCPQEQPRRRWVE